MGLPRVFYVPFAERGAPLPRVCVFVRHLHHSSLASVMIVLTWNVGGLSRRVASLFGGGVKGRCLVFVVDSTTLDEISPP